MTQAEVAEFFLVTSHTVNSWIRKGFLEPTRTAGDHKRFRTSDILALTDLDSNGPAPSPQPAA